MTDEFKLPSSSFEELNKIIQGYVTEVSKATGMRNDTISRNVGFLVALGILEGRRDKSSTSLGKDLGKALLHGQDKEVRWNYSSIVSVSEFLKSVTNAIRIRKGMDEGSLRSHIAYSAGAMNNANTKTGSGAIIELLKVAGAIRDEDGKFVVANDGTETSTRVGGPNENRLIVPHSGTRSAMKFHGDGVQQPTATNSVAPEASVQIKININVNCELSDLDEVGEKLQGILVSLKDQKVEVDGRVGVEVDHLQE